MSQIAQTIQAVATGEKRAARKKLSPLFEKMASADLQSSHEPLNMVTFFRLQLKLVNQFCVSDLDVMKQPNGSSAYTEAVARAKRQMIEAVFGEFRPYFRRLEQAIYDYDMEEAGAILREMEDVMYGLGQD
jgi:hypothetical protein